MRRKQQILVGRVSRELRCQRARDEEGAANTGRRSEQRAALPVTARDVEGAANTSRKSEQRAALPVSARDEEGAASQYRQLS